MHQIDTLRGRAIVLLVESMSGALAGFALATAAGLVGRALGQGSASGWGDLVGNVLGLIAGYILGAPLGVTVSARLMKQPGVAWRALFGSITGGVAVLLLAEPLRLNRDVTTLMVAFGGIALAGALIGFQTRRRSARRGTASG